MQLRDITMRGNEHGQLLADTIYAKLYNNDGTMAISATLEYILAEIRDQGYEVEGVTVKRRESRGTFCSEISLTRY